MQLISTTVHNGWLDVGADGAGAAANGLDLLDDLPRLLVGNLTEDNVLAIEPRGHNGGDEELGAVAIWKLSASVLVSKGRRTLRNSRVGASVGHREDTRLGVLVGPVLIGELFAVD